MFDQKQPRGYIARLRNDPRLHAMMQGWVGQATMEAEQRYPHPDQYAARAHDAAQRAIGLALSFVLDNDGEYQMLREELDRALKNTIDLVNAKPISLVIERPSAKP